MALIRSAQEEYRLNSLNAITNPAKMWIALARLGLFKTKLSSLSFFSPDQLNTYYATISAAVRSCSRSELLALTA